MSQHHGLRAAVGASPSDPYFSNTVLLLQGNGSNGGQNNTFIDSSTNNFTITRNGNVTQGTFSPFTLAAGSEYSASTNGGSGFFDGSGDYLSKTADDAFKPGTGNFTIEAWVYVSSVSATPGIFDCRVSGNEAGGFWFGLNTSAKLVFYTNATKLTASTALSLNTWHHVAMTRSGSTVTIWLNGVSDGTVTNSDNFTTGGCYVGSAYTGTDNPFTGYISSLRFLKGTAQYTSAFTPPTAPLTAISNTSLLLNFTNGSILDSTARNDLETVGDAQVSTSTKKFGTGSLKFDGTGDALVVNGTASDFAFGSGDFTIEFWLYINTTSGAQIIYDSRPLSTQTTQATLYLASGGSIRYYTGSADRITGSTLSASTWYHIALCRSGTSTKLFVDGTQSGSTYTDSTSYTNTTGRPVLGIDGFNMNANYLNGNLDDLRVTKYARYTANFTAPTRQLPAR